VSSNIEAANAPNSNYIDDDAIDSMLAEDFTNESEDIPTLKSEPTPSLNADERREAAKDSGKKKKLTKNQVALLGVVSIVIFFVVMLMVSAPSKNEPKPAVSGGFTSTSQSQFSAVVDSEEILELKQDIKDLKKELDSTKDSADKAFESIAVSLKNLQASNKTIVDEVGLVKEKYDELLSNGNNKFVDQSQKLSRLQKDFNEKILYVQKELDAFKEDQNNKLDIAKRKQYEVVSVVSGKALIRDVGSGKELRISHGVELDGFGVISDIDITGCITFETGERYTPIKGRCS